MAAGTEISPEQLQALLAALSIKAHPIGEDTPHSGFRHVTGTGTQVDGNQTYVVVDPKSGRATAVVVGDAHFGAHGKQALSHDWLNNPNLPFTRSAALLRSLASGPVPWPPLERPVYRRVIDSWASLCDAFAEAEKEIGAVEELDLSQGATDQNLPGADIAAEAILEAELKGLNLYLDSVSAKVEDFLARQNTKGGLVSED